MKRFKARKLFPTKRKPPGMPKLGPARPRRPDGVTPPLPLSNEAQAEADRYFARATIKAMREKHHPKEDL